MVICVSTNISSLESRASLIQMSGWGYHSLERFSEVGLVSQYSSC